MTEIAIFSSFLMHVQRDSTAWGGLIVLISIIFDIPKESHYDCARQGYAGHQDKEIIPAEMVGKPPQARSGEDNGKITHHANQSDAC